MEKYEIVSFIPARGGSERIPKKNIKMLAGKPMIAWTIEASLGSKYINRTFVSTEDKEIKEVALKYGAEVIDRPAKFSKGEINLNFAYSHFQYYLWEGRYRPDYVILLLPTSPLRTANHIDEAFELCIKLESPLLASVTKVHYVLNNTYLINGSGRLEHLLKESTMRVVSKKLRGGFSGRPTIYYENSAICIGVYNGIDCLNYSYVESVLPYIMSPEDSIDIDTPFDFKVAEMLLEERTKGRSRND